MTNELFQRIIVCLLAFTLTSAALNAQNKVVAGTASNTSGTSLAGATVSRQGGKAVTTSDAIEIFKITSLGKTSALLISFVKMEAYKYQ